MAEGLCRDALHRRGVSDAFEVHSAGTAAYHLGALPDPRTAALLRGRDIVVTSRARQVEARDFEDFDHILAMDSSNLRVLRRRCPPRLHHKVKLVLDTTGGGDVIDPYYGGPSGFERNASQLDEALARWIDRWLTERGSSPA